MSTNLWSRTIAQLFAAMTVLHAPACGKAVSPRTAEGHAEHADNEHKEQHGGEHGDEHEERHHDEHGEKRGEKHNDAEDKDAAHREHVHLTFDSTPAAGGLADAASPTSGPSQESAAVHVSEIATELVAKQLLIPTIGVPGRVEFDGDAVAQVGSPVKGRVLELPVAVGRVVAAGQLLLVIESPEFGEAQSEFLQRRSAVRAAGPSIGVARSSFSRAKALYDESRAIALTEVERREADLRAAESALTVAHAGATAAEAKLRLMGMAPEVIAKLANSGQINPRYELLAPVTGTVIERRAVRGQLVNPDDPALVVLADPLRLWLTADVPESAASALRVGANATVKHSRDAESGLPAHVALIAAAVNPATRTLQVRLAAVLHADQAHLLRPGMFVWVDLDLAGAGRGSQSPVLAVHASAVVEQEGEAQVFVAVPGENHGYVPRTVRVGPQVGALRQVLAGLEERERVVVRGAFLLKAEAGKSEAGHEH